MPVTCLNLFSSILLSSLFSLSFSHSPFLCHFILLSIFFLSLSFYLIVVVPQQYSVNVMDEHVLRGNAAIVKCHIPSFVIDFVYVSAWILDDNNEIMEIYADQNGIDINTLGTWSTWILFSSSTSFFWILNGNSVYDKFRVKFVFYVQNFRL